MTSFRKTLFSLVILAFATMLSAQTDPTPAQIAANWATFSGGLGGLVLYNQNGKACVLDLKTGAAKEVLFVKKQGES